MTNSQTAETQPWPELSKREREVAEMLAMGKDNHHIASVLGINVKTVDTFRGKVYRKVVDASGKFIAGRTGCRSDVLLALEAVRRGYITVDGLRSASIETLATAPESSGDGT